MEREKTDGEMELVCNDSWAWKLSKFKYMIMNSNVSNPSPDSQCHAILTFQTLDLPVSVLSLFMCSVTTRRHWVINKMHHTVFAPRGNLLSSSLLRNCCGTSGPAGEARTTEETFTASVRAENVAIRDNTKDFPVSSQWTKEPSSLSGQLFNLSVGSSSAETFSSSK